MKKQFVLKQASGLVIGVAAALVAVAPAQAANDQVKTWGNDSYSIEMGPDISSPSEARGAQGPVRDDAALTEGKATEQSGTTDQKPVHATELIQP